MPSTSTVPLGRLVKRGDQPDDGRFAGSRRTHQRRHRSGLGLETDIVQHRLARFVFEADVFENHVAFDRSRASRCARGHLLPRISRSISRVRSRPARASVNCVPIATICATGAIRNAMNAVNVTKSPSVIWPAQIWRVPRNITVRADDAQQHVGGEPHQRSGSKRLRDVVRAGACTPLANTSSSRVFGVVALHYADAAQRFGQPAGDFGGDFAALAEDGPDRSERLLQNARRTRAMKNKARPVISGADAEQNDQGENSAVSSPPTNSTRPVPIRLRMPSTSVMMRETSVPVLLES